MQIEREIKASGLVGLFQKMRVLVQSLNADEVMLVRKYLLWGRTSGKKTQVLQLFDFLLQHSEFNVKLIRTEYAAYKNKTIGMTLFRLREKILTVLSSELNYMREGVPADRAKNTFLIKDMLKQVHDLHARGMQSLALERMDDSIVLGKKYEFYTELLEVLYIKLSHLKIRSNLAEIHTIEAEIDFYEAARRAVIYAERINYKITTELAATANPDTQLLNELSKAVHELEILHYQTQASFVLYYKYRLQLVHLQLIQDHTATEHISSELVTLVTKSPALANTQRIAIAYMYLAQAKLYSYKFEETLVHCQQAKQLLKVGSWNYSETMLLEYYANFYLNRFDASLAIVDELIDNPLYPVSEYKAGERRYLRVYALLALDRFAEAQEQLAQIFKITKDKTGWNIGMRLLGMLLSCVTKNFDRMHFDHKALLKDLNRIKDQTNVTKRDLLIASLLRDLLKSSGDFKALSKKREKDLERLANVSGEHTWRLMGHELIPFEQWLWCKIAKQPTRIQLSLPVHSAQTSSKELKANNKTIH